MALRVGLTPCLHHLPWLFFFGPWQSPFIYPLGTENVSGCTGAVEILIKASHLHLMPRLEPPSERM